MLLNMVDSTYDSTFTISSKQREVLWTKGSTTLPNKVCTIPHNSKDTIEDVVVFTYTDNSHGLRQEYKWCI